MCLRVRWEWTVEMVRRGVRTVITRTTGDEDVLTLGRRVDLVYCHDDSASVSLAVLIYDVPACETDNPANSISWSME